MSFLPEIASALAETDRDIVAIKPIAKGEEITIHYGKAEGIRLQRQWNLQGSLCTTLTMHGGHTS